jgi:hypothetical protein
MTVTDVSTLLPDLPRNGLHDGDRIGASAVLRTAVVDHLGQLP